MKVVLDGGAGGVGASLAYNLLLGDQTHEIVLVDPRERTAVSHIMDLEQVLELGARGTVRAGTIADTADADIVVVTASAPLRANASRLVFLEENAALIADLADVIRGHGPAWGGVVVMVTNPVDPLVMHMHRRSGLDRRRVIGYTINDSLRLRTGISRATGRRPGSIEAWVIGEHGDGSVPLFSAVRCSGKPLTLDRAQQAAASEFMRGWYVRHVALDPTRSSTWTSGLGVAQMIAAIGGGGAAPTPASVVLDGEYGLRDVSVTVPVTLGREGVISIVEWPLADAERDALQRAADTVRAAAAQI